MRVDPHPPGSAGTPDALATKRELRALVRADRAERSDRAEAARQLTERLGALVTELRATRVSCFVGTGTEPDTVGFLAWARSRGIDVLLPRSLPDGTLEWARAGDAPLIPGAFGILEPTGPALPPDALAHCGLMLVPAASVDRRGTRLGWGRGYFDRALRAIDHRQVPVYAVVFEREVVEELPREPHDVPVTGAVTEVRTHRFG